VADDDEERPTAAKGRRRTSQPVEPAGDTPPATEPPRESVEHAPQDAADQGPEDAGPAIASDASASTRVVPRRVLRALLHDVPPATRNQFIPGTLTVHYKTRDVQFPMDGETAMRMLAVLAGTDNDIDDIVRSSDATRIWLMIDRTDVMGAQWTPDEATVPLRVTMDPAGLVDASS
jgi:hypothetical protein